MPEEHRSPPRVTTLHALYEAALRRVPETYRRRMRLAFNAGVVTGYVLGAEYERGHRQKRASAQNASQHARVSRAEQRRQWSAEAFEKYERLIQRGTLSRTQALRIVAKQIKSQKHLQSLSWRTVQRELKRHQRKS